MRAYVTGWSLHLPGVDLRADLTVALGSAPGAWADEAAAAPERAAAVLGRKGLLYKEPATRLALCAVHRALGLPLGKRAELPSSPGTAVIACSVLGNVETVAKVARTVEAEGGRAVSVLDAPNVSSNVIASNVALWFGFGGPNLMVCSGPSSGAAGLRLADLLLRAGRAERVVLVGAEPADEVAAALHGERLRAGGACVVLSKKPSGPGQPVVDYGPAGSRITVGPGGVDPMSQWGDYYGAHHVVSMALGAHLAADGYGPTTVHLGDWPVTLSCEGTAAR